MVKGRKRGRTRGRPAGEEREATAANVREEVAVRIAVAAERRPEELCGNVHVVVRLSIKD